MHKSTKEKILNRYERRNKAIDFIKLGQEKRDALDPIKDKEELERVNLLIDGATSHIIHELDAMLAEVEYQL
jgi:hypothetical protein